MSFNAFNAFSNSVSSGGGGEQGYTSAANFSALPTASAHSGEVYTVLNPEGLWLLDRKEAGLYRSDGATWTRLGSWLDAFDDANFTLYNTSDNTKLAKFDASAITTLTTRTYVLPDGDGILALTSDIPNHWTPQAVDDTSTANTLYGGQKDLTTLDWRIKKVVGDTPIITIADQTNNVTYTDYDSAWTDRLTLNYA